MIIQYIKVEATFGADSDSFAKNNNFGGIYENVPQEIGGPVYRKVDDHDILIYRSTIDDGWHFEKVNGTPNGQGQLRKLGLFVMQNGDDNACGNEHSDGWEFQVSPGVYQAYADLPVAEQDTFALFNCKYFIVSTDTSDSIQGTIVNLVHVSSDRVKMMVHVWKSVMDTNANVLLVSVVPIVRLPHVPLNPVRIWVHARSLVVHINAHVKLDILVMTVK